MKSYYLRGARLTKEERKKLIDMGLHIYSLRDGGDNTLTIEKFVCVNHVADLVTNFPMRETINEAAVVTTDWINRKYFEMGGWKKDNRSTADEDKE